MHPLTIPTAVQVVVKSDSVLILRMKVEALDFDRFMRPVDKSGKQTYPGAP
jgi:hypothetical protein